MKKKTILIGAISLVIIACCLVWLNRQWKHEPNVEIEREQSFQDEQKETRPDSSDNKDSSQNLETDNWEIFRNEEYGFELKYPKSWEMTNLYNPSTKAYDLFFFERDKNKNLFAVYPKGGFGHGIQEPKKTTVGDFRGKNAKMLWYDYPFPLYTRITGDLPNNWGLENEIEVKISENDETAIDDLKAVYDSFQFISRR